MPLNNAANADRWDPGAALLIMAVGGIALLVFGARIAQAQIINVPAGDEAALVTAIQNANADAATPAVINITSTYSLSDAVAGVPFSPDGKNGLPSITSDISIVGSGAIIERDLSLDCELNSDIDNDEFRIFHVATTGKLTLTGITVRNGCADGPTFDERSGGGIFNQGEVTLRGSTLSENLAMSGGGIVNSGGTVRVLDGSTLSDNSAADEGGGIANFGVTATVHVTDSTLSGNEAIFFGGGIENLNGKVFITGSTLHMNISGTEGGGVFNSFSQLNQPVLEVTNSTFSENQSGFGGGIFTSDKVDVIGSTFVGNRARQGAGIWKEGLELNVTNSTFSGNIATEEGGGIYNDSFETNIVSSTFSGNSAASGGGFFNFETVNITNSIVANSLNGGDCGGPSVADLFAAGVNFDTDGSCKAAATDSGTGDAFTTVTALELHLGALTLNPPGQTPTHALLEDSVAIDAVPPGQCTVSEDQRGVSRPQGPQCDSGAYEVERPRRAVPLLSHWVLVLLSALLGLAPWYRGRWRAELRTVPSGPQCR